MCHGFDVDKSVIAAQALSLHQQGGGVFEEMRELGLSKTNVIEQP